MEAQSQQPSGTVTFLITDLVGSTEQLEQLGDEIAVPMTTRTIARLSETAVGHGGQVIKNMGDGIMVVFSAARAAIACAVSMQHIVSEPDDDGRAQLPVKIGVHAGEPVRTEGEYMGMPVNVAARICSSAAPGQIVVSDVVRGLVGSRDGHTFRDLGERTLRGLRAPVRLWEVTWKPSGPSTGDAGERGDGVLPETHTRPADLLPDTLVLLFADIVDSIPHTERLGDAQFRERARELDGLLRAIVSENRGTTVEGKLVGDGVLAVFPSARSAINCALACGALAASVGFELHLGIHAGDVIRDGNNVFGGAVNIASRISVATNPGEILVSETVRGIARTSGGVVFEDRGEYMLKGIDEPMRLFTVRAPE
jgi:class 3 adenylate cyclase